VVHRGGFSSSGDGRMGQRFGTHGRNARMDHANPTLEQLAQHWFYSLVLTPMLSRLLIHVLVFNFQVGGLGNVWLINSDCLRHMTGD
jgi:hypothetical protein